MPASQFRNRNRNARYAADPEKFRARQRAYDAIPANREAKNARTRARIAKLLLEQPVEYRAKKSQQHRLRTTGWSHERFLEYLDAQGSQCAICGKSFALDAREPQADHDHSSGEPRGLLCLACNSGLGLFKDDPEILQWAIEYLTEWSQDQTYLAAVE